MYSEKFLDHFQSPRHVGDLAPPAITVEVTNPACGDILRLAVAHEAGRIIDARYRVRGCTASIASGSALTELLAGMKLSDLQQVTAITVEAAVGGLTPETRHAAVLCADAVKSLRGRLAVAAQ